MTTERILALALSALFVFAAPALASAQHEPMRVEHITRSAPAVHRAHSDEAPHLLDESEHLTAPSAGDYALPIVGVVGGVLLVGGGGASLVVGLLAGIGESLSGEGRHETSTLLLGLGAGGLALGATVLIASIVELVHLRHRARDAELAASLGGIALAPVEGGAVATAWGTF